MTDHYKSVQGPMLPQRSSSKGLLLRCSVRNISQCLLALFLSYLLLIWFTIDVTTTHTTTTSNSMPSKQQTFLQQGNRINTTTVIHDKNTIVIGIVSSITGCGPDPFTEGAAVLKYSIDLTSIHGTKGGKYDYKMYIMYHPDASECALPLKDLGFELLERPTPVNVEEIQGEVLRERIVRNGCCGEKELIKLEAFRLIQHPVVIHLDLDVLVLQPMDPAIDLLLYPDQVTERNMHLDSFVMWPERPLPNELSLLFTKDYNIVAPGRKDKPFQGGFFMIKPSLETYHEFVNIVKEGDYRDEKGKRGWGGIVGPFHGGMTIQGLLPWYYEYLHPGRAVELNRCVYNSMADNPTTHPPINDIAQGRCRTNQEVSDCSHSVVPRALLMNSSIHILISLWIDDLDGITRHVRIVGIDPLSKLSPFITRCVTNPGVVLPAARTVLKCDCVIKLTMNGSSIDQSWRNRGVAMGLDPIPL